MLLLTTTLAALLGAPDLGAFRLEPWRNLVPDWFEGIEDSIPVGQTLERTSWTQDSSGRRLRLDTLRYDTESEFRHVSRTIHGLDSIPRVTTCRAVLHRSSGTMDSLDERSLEGGKQVSYTSGHRWFFEVAPTPNTCPEGWFLFEGTGPSTLAQADTILLHRERTSAPCRDRAGRFLSQTSVHNSSMGRALQADTVQWDGSTPDLWIDTDSGFAPPTASRHHLTWDGTRLVRDSVEQGIRFGTVGNVATAVTTCEWSQGRLRACLRDGDTTVAIDRDLDGRPIRQRTTDADATLPALQTWTWDPHGRLLARTWLEWGELSPPFSRIEAHYPDPTSPWPDSLETLRCTSIEADSCRMVELQVFAAPVAHAAGLSPRATSGHPTPRLVVRGSRLELLDAPTEAARLILLSPSGRRLASCPVTAGRLSQPLPPLSGVVAWTLISPTGTRLASGRILVHTP